MRRVCFASGTSIRGWMLSPRLTLLQRRAAAYWLRRLPAPFSQLLPRLKVAVADRLLLVGEHLFIDQPPSSGVPGRAFRQTHAASFLPERYIVLHASLFRKRVELGRILYHELCHFLWPRLGNPRRALFAALLQKEIEQGMGGELGYSSEWRKEALLARKQTGVRIVPRKWREYACESFCDTGAYVLLGEERRGRHSEFTLNKKARNRRARLWWRIVLGQPAGR